VNAGLGVIKREMAGDDLFFHFTALPGQGYRTIRASVPVQFEIVEGRAGLTARNIQRNNES
jgi:cold shock CspA family protein